MAITDWPQAERPRDKLLSKGPGTLSDAELLAIILRTGYRGVTSVQLARDLLAQSGGLRALLDSVQNGTHSNLSAQKNAELKACLELSKRYLHCQLQRGNLLQNARQTGDYLMAALRSYRHEVFACLFLDNAHRLIALEEIAHGTIDSAQVNLRAIVERSLALNASALIAAHNHPSGNRTASAADRELTKRLQQALALIDVRVIDHFIVGDGRPTSFAEHGWL